MCKYTKATYFDKLHLVPKILKRYVSERLFKYNCGDPTERLYEIFK